MSQDDLSVENANDRFKKLGKRGSELFAIPTPGETYNELTGAIGHSAVDMSIGGNGLLSFDVRREFEPKPAAYPHDLSTMSLRIPHISFEAYSSTIGPAMSCSQWQSEGGEVFNDIQLQSMGGNASLIHRMQVHEAARGLYPATANYISKDHWILDCVGAEYRARSPEGLIYYFNANKGAEHVWRNRIIRNLQNSQISVKQFTQYKIYVDRIERLHSILSFHYTAPQPTNDADNPYPTVQNYRARPPVHFDSDDDPDTGSIHNKRRLVRVELRAGNENAANASQTENQFLYFTYRGVTEDCPGLLQSVHSTTTKVSKVVYEYEPIQGALKSIAAPQSRCVLKHVKRNALAWYNANVLKRAWTFEYGAVGSQTPYYLPASGNRGHWWQYYGTSAVSSLPLHSVITPTGAKTTYEYNTGYVCDYQDSHDNYRENPASACNNGKRLVNGI